MSMRSRSRAGFVLFQHNAKAANRTSSSGKAIRGTAEIARDGRDHFKVYMLLRGGGVLSQFGRTQRVGPGSYIFMSQGEPCSFEGWSDRGETSAITFMMPREFVLDRLARASDVCVRPRATTKTFQSLVFGKIGLFGKNAWTMTREEFVGSARGIADLILLELAGCSEMSCWEAPARAANLSRIKRIIRERLAEPELTLTDIAHQAGLSLGYVHKLFSDEALTAYEYLKSERLRRAYQLLEGPRSASIADICFECGFSDHAYFSRLFKRAFGISPRDVLGSKAIAASVAR